MKEILKIKKQALQNAELELNKAKKRQEKIINDIFLCDEEFKNVNTAKDLTQILLQNEALKNNLSIKQALLEKLELSKKEIVHYEHLYKRANLEYEKIKILHEEELLKIKQEKEKKLALELDEIATIRFFNSLKEQEL
ncbi:hypothetical protein [Campylobacter canadensis]|uniref:Flagellar FliJ protein n=1 Tax=Campylobacter canadensis TaxID=449520 RepID=A0ABS7WTS0_9BACT|nr:hypothetical protein [Campylobacter canadensis]MBZ7987928.1 hypothetical protein [Campylobacter canadensis]MBZ7995403.1 hypothetical protein [Campylobacter canadensis]MBZ7997051.1 hypothetical protein [Campylobacter canadensis]MBZ7998901.1 hypothetical protein [Campylobacter canadensis]MBZ8000580.1 hypothetical protein [Campylobacter canadensis]